MRVHEGTRGRVRERETASEQASETELERSSDSLFDCIRPHVLLTACRRTGISYVSPGISPQASPQGRFQAAPQSQYQAAQQGQFHAPPRSQFHGSPSRTNGGQPDAGHVFGVARRAPTPVEDPVAFEQYADITVRASPLCSCLLSATNRIRQNC